MRINTIRTRNINSLAGDCVIDFDAPPLAGCGIFAITGPTGAGKTTILDAICAALYGQTPRLGAGDCAELMSRHTGETMAEVEFTVPKGRYRSRFSLRRARGRADGRLQPPEMELAEFVGHDWRIIEEKKSRVPALVETITGLDFHRFTRSVLLAQGGFAAFLNATDNERADLLEKMTGAGIYSLVSEEVFRRAAEEKKKLDEMIAAANSLTLRPDEEISGMAARCTDLAAECGRLVAAEEKANADLKWLAALAGQQAIMAESGAALARLDQERERRLPEFKKLAASQRTIALAGDWSILRDLRKRSSQKEAALATLKRDLPAREEKIAALETARENLALRFAAWKLQLSREEPKILAAERLDQTIAAKKNELATTTGDRQRLEPRLASLRREEEKAAAELAALDQEREKLAAGLAGQGLHPARYGEDRARLVEGEPCPLCGATSHPWAGMSPAEPAMLAELRQREERLLELENYSVPLREKKIRQEEEKKHLLAQLAVLNERRAGQEAELARLGLARRELFGDRDPARERQRLAVERESFDRHTNAQAATLLREREGLAAGRLLAETLARETAELAQGSTERGLAFTAKLHEAGFNGEEDFASAVMPEDERRRLEKIDKELADRRLAAETRRADAEKNLAALRETQRTDREEAAISAELAAIRQNLKDRHEEGGSLRSLLGEQEKLRREQTARLAGIDRQRRESDRWARLNALIGSADGRKFRRYAQGLTLDWLIDLANRHLMRLNDRYQLVRNEGEELGLLVIDTYQADARRPTATLSGGEGFLASLALALGLAGMASRDTAIDSLFLDEGFGSLDADTLETALSALAGIHTAGKTIGVISHVEALKERIAVQIAVEKKRGGISRVRVIG